ncbi:hypothetical protein L3Y34_006589 [Caenorhabditis briggsae]|uniref:PRA1 family protein n=1 Tax=Caenorhabditis briggsae TaxID=6238 RepID=A0AAE9CY25_CAEBR|nr:hypothetical protein L3Y34_006589 [Caenorhabditis briggsae]
MIASAYKAFYQKNLEAWKKLPEFPIFSHANYIHENVYARYQNSLLISILTIICCAIHLSQTISFVLLAVLTVILVTVYSFHIRTSSSRSDCYGCVGRFYEVKRGFDRL